MSADFTFIRRVQIANIDNTTEGFPATTNGYSDYSAQLTELTQGQSYQLIVTPDYTNSDNIGVGAWIDWNQDGDFDDAGEEVLMKKGRFGTAEAMIQVPANTTLNVATRLRIRLNYRDENPQACGADSYMGEVEDYSIVVINGSIAGQAPTAVISSNINYTIRNGAINFENQSTGNPTSIMWEFAGGNPATSTANNPTVTYANNGIFPVTLTASNANGRDKTIAYVTVKKGGGVDGEYCTTSNSRDDVHINNVTLGSINNSSGFSNNGYGDFTSISTVLARNTAHSLSVSATQAWSLNTVRVWIDWNQDGDFNDDGERVLDASGDGTPYTSSFNVPASAKEGGTRMRVRLAYSVEAQSCGEGSIGEVEDYIVYVGQVTPTADFSADKTIITAGESVSFTNTSAGNPTTFAWTFAGGSPANSTAQNPVVAYNTPGVYEVSLTVGDGQTTNTKTVSSLITVNPAPVIPVADFSANVTTIEAGQSVTFTDLSTNEPTSWNWTFAGGSPASSTVQTPTVTYNTPGVYEVSLTAANTAGSNTKTVSAFITVTAPNCTYCGASASNSTYEYIDQVQLGSFSYTSGNNGGYSDNTGQTIQVTSGQNYTVNLTPGFSGASYTETFRIWIDYNKDCDFDDAGELVFEGSGSSLVSGSVTIQAGLSNLNTQMRVAMQYNGASASCGSFTYGEVEDYAIQIQEGDIVTPPTTSYCAASAQNTGSEHITRVQIGSIDNATTSSGYGDYTGLSTNIVQGSNQNITVTPSVSWSLSKLSIWVDWNQDGDFDDVGESTVINGAGPYATTLAAPANATIGSTRMRIRLSYGNAVSTFCGDGWTGEVEDYTIQVTSSASARTSNNLGVVREMLQVFPNPTINGKIMVSLPHRALLEREANAQISITDLNGRTVKSLTTDRSQTEVKLNDLPKGLYVIQVSLQGQTYTKRLMIK